MSEIIMHTSKVESDGSITFTCEMPADEATSRARAASESGGLVSFRHFTDDKGTTFGSTTFQLGSQDKPNWGVVDDFNDKIPGFGKKADKLK